jgi:rare lipoprotein A
MRFMKCFLLTARIQDGLLSAVAAVICLGALSTAAGTNPRISAPLAPAAESGTASFYAGKYHGKPTASGEIFDMRQLTAAHPRLAFGTVVKVTNTENNRSVLVRINDRGPFVAGRVIDLSLAAAEELRMVKSGLAQVKLEIVR